VKRIGIYSGTFDPVHNGHVALAKEAVSQCDLDKVFFLIEPRPRRKQGVKAYEHRAEMVRLAIAGESRLASILLGQSRFTPHETLPLLKARFKGAQLCMLMGDDMLTHLGDWPHVEELTGAVQLIIGARDSDAEAVHQRMKTLKEVAGLNFNYTTFSAPESILSSSKIRRAVKAGHQPDGINSRVWEYIKAEGLYASVAE
jgi:nicotinate-nucleotide adenylyltransferase